jgi:hypothetical protein
MNGAALRGRAVRFWFVALKQRTSATAQIRASVSAAVALEQQTNKEMMDQAR